MVRFVIFLLGVAALVVATLIPAAANNEPPSMDPNLGPLAPFVGRTLAAYGPNGELADVQVWRWRIGGRAIEIEHTLGSGAYGGVTLIYWDQANETLAYTYVTTGGFRTEGVMSVVEGGYEAREAVTGHPTITEVASTSILTGDDEWTTSSRYFDNGDWVDGHSFVYRPSDSAALNYNNLPVPGESG